MDFAQDRRRDARRPDFEKGGSRLVGEALRAEQTGKAGDENQERKNRGQAGERDMAGHGVAIVLLEISGGVP